MGRRLALLLAMFLAIPPIAHAEPIFPVVDLHVDIPWQVHFRGHPIDLSKGQYTRDAMSRGHVAGVVLPLYIPVTWKKGHPDPSDLDDVLQTIEKLVWAPGSPFSIQPPETVPRVRAWLSIEGAEALADDPAAIEGFVKKGVRLVGVAHTIDNSLSGSSTGKKRKGLTDKGKELCAHALDAGALLDVSHLSDAAFSDVVKLSVEHEVPVVASHSDARAIADHPRNLTDAQLTQIAASGGIVGLNLHGPYVSTSANPGMTEVLRQADHLIEIAGEDHVAMGSDYDGGITPPAALPDGSSFPALAHALLAHGWSEARVRKVFSENALRVLGFTTDKRAR